MDQKSLEIGDVVTIRSLRNKDGMIRMTVNWVGKKQPNIESTEVGCVWFDGWTLQKSSFSMGALIHINSEKPKG